jgi:hypothetical protein
VAEVLLVEDVSSSALYKSARTDQYFSNDDGHANDDAAKTEYAAKELGWCTIPESDSTAHTTSANDVSSNSKPSSP